MNNTNNIIRNISYINESIVKVEFENNIQIGLDDMKNALDYYDSITEKKTLKKLLITGYRTFINKEARQYGYQQMKLKKNQVIAEAFVVHNLPQKMVVNFYITFIKKDYPIKFFTDEESALKWLNSI
ncbi:MAG: hypothetical protein Q8K70_10170 [Bacteroidota bacterium]|nr:hypothetical protein [Bacteroidota bacterium]